MTLTVGTDTYISLADANAYVALFFISTDAKLIAWDLVAEADKEIILRRATQSIETIKFPGKKYDPDQTLSFPRADAPVLPLRRENTILSTYWSEDWWLDDGTVPDKVKYAQVEEALEIASPSKDSARKSRLTGAQNSFSIGNYSENIAGGGAATGTPKTVLLSIRAQELLADFANGSFSVV